MLTLHIKALSGPRPVTAGAVRELLAGGRIGPRSQVLSLDCGRTWIPVDDALAVVDQLSVADADIDAAMAGGKTLHPIGMPVGGLAIGLLIAGIAFGNGPEATAVITAPQVAATTAGELVTAGAQGVGAGASAMVQMATAGWSACLTAGSLPGGMQPVPAMAAIDVSPPMPGAAAASATAAPEPQDLQAAWSRLVADRNAEAGAWKAATEQLGASTIASGIKSWTVTIAQAEPISASQAKAFPKAKKPVRFAEFVAGKDDAGGSLLVMTVIEDKAVAEALDTAAKEQRSVRITAEVDKAQSEASNRTVVLNGYVTAIE